MEELTRVFMALLEMSLTAIPVILVLFFLRFLLKKAPRGYSYALWVVAGFRLLCPVALPSDWSLFNLPGLTQTDPKRAVALTERAIAAGTQVLRPATGANQNLTTAAPAVSGISTAPVAPAAPAAPALTWDMMGIAALIWLAGMIAVLLWTAFQFLRLYRRTDAAVRVEGNVWESDRIPGPFVLGLFRPKIFLPCGLGEEARTYVLAHERYHIRRYDPLVKALSVLILALHWFNPLVWLALWAMDRDMELSCDEGALRTLGGDCRQDYSRTLLALGANRREFGPALAFGTPAVKQRIVHVLAFRKAGRVTVVLALVILLAAALTCCTDAVTGGWVEWSGSDETYTYRLPQDTQTLAVYLQERSEDRVLDPHVHVIVYGEWDRKSGTIRLSVTPEDDFMYWDLALGEAEPAAQFITQWSQWEEGADVSFGQPAERMELTLDQPTELVTVQKTRPDGQITSMTCYLYPSSLSEQETFDKLNGLDYAQRLYDARVQYVGDNSAVGALRYVVVEQDVYQDCTMELFTSEEPYGLALYFTAPEDWTGSEEEMSQACTEAYRNAVLMLALIDNAEYYRQTVGTFECLTVTVQQVEERLGIDDLKAYGQSELGVSELLDRFGQLLDEDGYLFSVLSLGTAEIVETPASASYYLQNEAGDGQFLPCLTLSADGTFGFSYDVLSSYYTTGSWTEAEGKVLCETDDGKYHYTFLRVDAVTLQFLQAESSSVEVIAPGTSGVQIQDGDLFVTEQTAQAVLTGLYPAETVLQSGELVEQLYGSAIPMDVYLLGDYCYGIDRETGQVSIINRTQEALDGEQPASDVCTEEEAAAVFSALVTQYYPEIDTAYAAVERETGEDGSFLYRLEEVQGDALVNTCTLLLDSYGQPVSMSGSHNIIADFAGTDWFDREDFIQRTLEVMKDGLETGDDERLTFSGVTSEEDMEGLTVRKILKRNTLDGKRVYWRVAFQATADQDGQLYELELDFDAKTGVRDTIGWSTQREDGEETPAADSATP